MKLSAPIYVLKAQAKELKKSQNITMTKALNIVAQREGFSTWSLLQSKAGKWLPKKRSDILDYLNPGDLVIVASRPGQGKTRFALQLLFQAVQKGRRAFVFSLEESRRQVASRLADIDVTIGENHPQWGFDFSDEISAEYIIQALTNKVTPGAIVAIDYLQLLDQKRNKPDLNTQVSALKDFAKAQSCILVFISQVDRSFEDRQGNVPEIRDLRLPNPVDLTLVNKVLFLNDEKVHFVAPSEFVIS